MLRKLLLISHSIWFRGQEAYAQQGEGSVGDWLQWNWGILWCVDEWSHHVRTKGYKVSKPSIQATHIAGLHFSLSPLRSPYPYPIGHPFQMWWFCSWCCTQSLPFYGISSFSFTINFLPLSKEKYWKSDQTWNKLLWKLGLLRESNTTNSSAPRFVISLIHWQLPGEEEAVGHLHSQN